MKREEMTQEYEYWKAGFNEDLLGDCLAYYKTKLTESNVLITSD